MMKTYTIKRDTKLIENENEITLRRGVIHKNELTIDKEKSSKEFLTGFQSLVKNGTFKVSSDNPIYDDFESLSKFDFLTVAQEKNAISLLVVDDVLIGKAKPHFSEHVKIMAASDFLSASELSVLLEDKNILQVTTISEHKQQLLTNFGHIYLMTSMTSLSFLRGFNKLMKLTEQIHTIAVFDNKNIFISCIQHGETGCYECLEQQMMSRFEGVVEDYMIDFAMDVSTSELLIAIALIKKDMANIHTYGQSALLGNVIHFNIDHYEYSFNTNRIQSTCSTCATFNNILFEEQNIRSVNILKEMMQHD